jgi:hypothetical protein
MAVTPTGGRKSMGDRASRFVTRLRQLISPVFAQTQVDEEKIRKREQAQRERTLAPAAGPPEAQTGNSTQDEQNDEANGEDATG